MEEGPAHGGDGTVPYQVRRPPTAQAPIAAVQLQSIAAWMAKPVPPPAEDSEPPGQGFRWDAAESTVSGIQGRHHSLVDVAVDASPEAVHRVLGLACNPGVLRHPL